MSNVATFIVLGAEMAKSSDSFLAALIGAVVGGAVSLVTTLLVDRQRARGASTEQRRQQLADARLSGRVIRLELAEIESVLRVAIQQTPFRWPLSSGYELRSKAWSGYSAKLGAVVADSVWDEVTLPYSLFEYANLLGSVTSASAQIMLDGIQDAIKALDSWAASASLKNPVEKG